MSITLALPAFAATITLGMILKFIMWCVVGFAAFAIFLEFIFWWAGARGD